VAADAWTPRPRLAAADRNCIFTFGDDDVSGFRYHAEIATLQVKFDHLARTRFEMDALESAKSADWRTGDVRKLEIELRDFVAHEMAGVCYGHGDVERLAGIDWSSWQSEVVIFERRIAEAVSERPQRLSF